MLSESAASDLLEKVEQARLERRFTQSAVAETLGITQPHYSKIVRGAVTLTADMHDAMTGWLDRNPPDPKSSSDELLRLTQRIERDVARLNRLLALEGRRPPKRPRSRSAKISKDS